MPRALDIADIEEWAGEREQVQAIAPIPVDLLAATLEQMLIRQLGLPMSREGQLGRRLVSEVRAQAGEERPKVEGTIAGVPISGGYGSFDPRSGRLTAVSTTAAEYHRPEPLVAAAQLLEQRGVPVRELARAVPSSLEERNVLRQQAQWGQVSEAAATLQGRRQPLPADVLQQTQARMGVVARESWARWKQSQLIAPEIRERLEALRRAGAVVPKSYREQLQFVRNLAQREQSRQGVPSSPIPAGTGQPTFSGQPAVVPAPAAEFVDPRGQARTTIIAPTPEPGPAVAPVPGGELEPAIAGLERTLEPWVKEIWPTLTAGRQPRGELAQTTQRVLGWKGIIQKALAQPKAGGELAQRARALQERGSWGMIDVAAETFGLSAPTPPGGRETQEPTLQGRPRPGQDWQREAEISAAGRLREFSEELSTASQQVKQYGGEMVKLTETTKRLGRTEGERVTMFERQVRQLEQGEALARGAGAAGQEWLQAQQGVLGIAQQFRAAQRARERDAQAGGGGLGGLFDRLFGGDGGGEGGWRGFGGTLGRGGLSGLGRELTSGWGAMKIRRLWRMAGGQIRPWMEAAGQEEMAMYQAAMVAGAPIAPPTGVGGGLIQRQIRAQAGRAALGRQAAAAWTPPEQLGMWEQGPLGAAVAIGQPALGAGAIAGMLAGGPAGLAVGAGVAAIGGANYLYQQAASDVGAAVGYADLINANIAYPGTRAEFGQRVGGLYRGIGEFLGGGLEGLERWEQQAIPTGQAIIAGQTAGLGQAEFQEAMRLRSQRLTEQYNIFSPAEYGAVQAQMQRFGGYENLADIPEQAIVRAAGLTRALGLKPGELQVQMGQVGRAWGLQSGEEMAAWQTMMTQAPTVQDYERQMQVYQQYQPLARWGVGMAEVGGAPRLSPREEYRLQQFAAGNRYLWSQAGRATGMPQFVTTEEGGLPTFTTGVGAQDYARMGLQTEAAREGMWGVQAGLRQENIEYAQVQRAYQRQAYEQQVQQLTGRSSRMFGMRGIAGALGLDYFTPTPDSAWGLQNQQRQAQYAQAQRGFGWQQAQMGMGREQWMTNYQMGMQRFQTGIAQTREMWGLQDVGARLGYVQAMGGVSPLGGQYAGRFDFQEARIGMGLGQFMQGQELSRRTFELQRGWQAQDWQRRQEDISRQFGRGMVQRGWTEEDWASQQARTGREFGWQMEDYEESIRFATGRERKRLMIQRERATTRFGEDEAQFQKQKDRQAEIWGWEDEDFERVKDRLGEERERNEELAKIQRERFDMQKRHQEESAGLALKQLEEQKLGYEENYLLAEQQRFTGRENQEEMWSLELEQHQERLAQYEERYEAEMKHLEQARADYEENYGISEKMIALQRQGQLDSLERQGEMLTIAEDHAGAIELLQGDYITLQQEQQRVLAYNNEIVASLELSSQVFLRLLEAAEILGRQGSAWAGSNQDTGLNIVGRGGMGGIPIEAY